jgi:hypothetical protein
LRGEKNCTTVSTIGLIFLYLVFGNKINIKETGEVAVPINLPDNRLFPEFSLPDLSGREISVKNYSGKRLIIFIWASW